LLTPQTTTRLCVLTHDLLVWGVKSVPSVLCASLKRQEPIKLSQSQSPSPIYTDINKADACGAAKVLDRAAQADARSGAQVLDRGAQPVARGAARCASQVLDRCARPSPAAPLFVRCRYLAVVPRPLPEAALVVYYRAVFIYCGAQAAARGGAGCALKVPNRSARPFPAAPRR
jgi:hypothetical protein